MAGPARVFISYSSKDTDIVDRLKAALANAGVVVWLDHEQLTPGTPNWEVKVREGIAQATHIVYAASPDAALSPYVIHEIEMARGNGKAVLPFWIRGENWYDCAPMGWYRTQYTDGRGAAYAAGLARLLPALGAIAPAAPPSPQPVAQPQQPPIAAKPSLGINLAAANAAPIIGHGPSAYPLPNVPPRLASLGFRGVNPHGTPAILPPLVSVVAGPFLMGSDKSRDPQARENELPQHRVELGAFEIGKYPVTVAEYALAVQAGAVGEPPTSAEVKSLGITSVSWRQQQERLDHPVVCVSWHDATKYAAWLAQVTGQPGWWLPSEAQWEKAARWDVARGVSRLYPWGDSFDEARCNTGESGIKATTPVGSYPATDSRHSGASSCGAEEMAGNVWEWTSSLFKSYPYSESDGREDRKSTENRTLRGGAWNGDPLDARAAYRGPFQPGIMNNLIGFRLVRVPGSFH